MSRISKALSFVTALALPVALWSCSPDTPNGYFCCKPSVEQERPLVEREITPVVPDNATPGEPQPGTAPLIPMTPDAPACLVESYVQPAGELTRGVDILFVTDTSGSLKEERMAAARGIVNFVDQLPADMDYRIGVVLAHGQKSPWFAKPFRSADGEEEILESSKLTPEEILSQLESKLTRVVLDYGTEGPGSAWHKNIGADAGEAGLLALENFASNDDGFIREDAALAVEFLADENDICSVYPGFTLYPEGVKPLASPGNTEDWFRKQGYCTGITPDSVLSALVRRKGDHPLLVSGIVYDNHSFPASGQNEYGYGYMNLIEEANGTSISLGDVRKIPEGLGKIGKLMNRKLNLISEYRVITPGYNPVQVKVDGKVVPFRYSVSSHSVILQEAGEQGSRIDVEVCQ